MSASGLRVAASEAPERERGSATVAALTFAFVFMAGSLVWLTRTVDRSIDDRSQAATVAFQAARSAAQQLDPDRARQGELVIDATRAAAAARATAARLLDGSGDVGVVSSMRIVGTRVVVEVTITSSGRASVGVGTAVATMGFDEAHRG